jgi:hypothetical protein
MGAPPVRHFAADRLKVQPSQLAIERLDAPLVLSFLEHLEHKRGNSARTRNARLAAINAFFLFLWADVAALAVRLFDRRAAADQQRRPGASI